MAYLVSHNGRLWFQIRVPTALIGRYGRLIRTNLQTRNRIVAYRDFLLQKVAARGTVGKKIGLI